MQTENEGIPRGFVGDKARVEPNKYNSKKYPDVPSIYPQIDQALNAGDTWSARLVCTPEKTRGGN